MCVFTNHKVQKNILLNEGYIFIHKELQPKLNKDCVRDYYSCLLETKSTAGTSATKQGEKACSL